MFERFQTFTVLIAKINRSIRRIKNEAMEEFDLKSPHVSCIHYLYPDKRLTVSELCEVCDEDKGAVSRSVKFLVKNEYVRYEQQQDKKYKNKLYLTDKGEKVGDFIADKMAEILAQTGEGMGKDLPTFYRCLKAVSDNLENTTMRLKDSKGEKQ